MTGERREFVDNRGGNTVADAILRAAEYFGNRREIAIASGYFNLGGFAIIANALEAAPRVRILLGSEPDAPRPKRSVLPGPPPASDGLSVRLAELRASMEADRDIAPFSPDTTRLIERL